MNDCHPKIKFIANFSPGETSFLDVAVKRTDNDLVIDPHIKPKETNKYLHASSYHRYHTK